MTRTKTLPTNFFRRALFRVRVTGESMWPEFVAGKTYWATGFLRPREGDAIVFRNPRDSKQMFVKRVRAVAADGYEVESTVPWGSGSGELGIVPREAVLGRVFN